MPTPSDIKKRAAELAQRDWDLPAIETRFRHLVDHGLPQKRTELETIARNRNVFLD